MRSLDSDDNLKFSTVAAEICDRWGFDNSLTSELARDLIKEERGHTIDHIDCPSCRAYDELMKADLLGMAGQTFAEATQVWQRARLKSNVLRYRTHESV
jgi:hypothetical protein